MVWIGYLVVVSAATWAAVGYSQGCRTRTGEVGICVNIRQCPDLHQLLHQIHGNRAPPGSIRRLRESVCDYYNRIPKVCCTSKQFTGTTDGASLLPTDCGRTSLPDRIVGGVDASLFAWPWMALLRGESERGSLWYCGGVLISTRYVLTAAHCVHASSRIALEFVRIGEYDLSKNPDCERRVCAPTPQDIPVEEVIIHDDFGSEPGCQRCHDIALLRLAIPAQLNTAHHHFDPYSTSAPPRLPQAAHVVPVCLPTNLERDLGIVNNDFSSQFAWVAGWGRDVADPSKESRPDVLQEALLPIGRSFCNISSYPDPNMVLCAGGEGVDSCAGDSGGPLLMEDSRTSRSFVVGVVSSGPTVCGAPQTQGLYTSVAFYVPWILQQLRP